MLAPERRAFSLATSSAGEEISAACSVAEGKCRAKATGMHPLPVPMSRMETPAPGPECCTEAPWVAERWAEDPWVAECCAEAPWVAVGPPAAAPSATQWTSSSVSGLGIVHLQQLSVKPGLAQYILNRTVGQQRCCVGLQQLLLGFAEGFVFPDDPVNAPDAKPAFHYQIGNGSSLPVVVNGGQLFNGMGIGFGYGHGCKPRESRPNRGGCPAVPGWRSPVGGPRLAPVV
jgi:hypothetical protein